ncbi:hypothetical protein [Dictyobacter kobayashii]|uniref:Uncharacterized protein n=1 Tax=Dictyobacter kobayashii TaxID=2014872 RepID=A0A402AK99_9CHLR|nr:hypothetical protein [Dictyobacter kobayashii]GCE19542.1 hypothetical protein KDK_33420 [Dictyobacter kobayashii]
MQDLFILCPWRDTMHLVRAIQEQLQGKEDIAEVLAHGMSSKLGQGFILLAWRGIVPETVITQLLHNGSITDFMVCEVADSPAEE